MTGEQQTEHSWPRSAGSVKTANELNAFYAFFTVRDFGEDRASLCQTVVAEQLDLFEASVVTSFPPMNSHNASGPDGLTPS